ncbi:MAG TPA: sialidase family protein, partial [Candidatus Anammoximicrobium sp.]|nr:sialidase family protein [Candidatus Anammoximicrobium sp.]
MRRTTRPTFVFSTTILLPILLAAGIGDAADRGPTLHPHAVPLPFAHQGPFVTSGDGGVLCVDAQQALHSGDEGRTWTATPIFRDEQKYRISNERALLRTRDGAVIAAWMNLQEQKSPPGWKWGEKDADWQDFVLPTYVCRSLDDGKTWEEPVFLNKPWCGCIHSLIETKTGRIVLVGQEVIPAWRHATVVFVSDDQGRTWQRSNVLDIGQGRHDHAGS